MKAKPYPGESEEGCSTLLSRSVQIEKKLSFKQTVAKVLKSAARRDASKFKIKPKPEKTYPEMSEEEVHAENVIDKKYQRINTEILLKAIFQDIDKDFSSETKELLDSKKSEEICRIKELNLQSIEMSKPITDVLFYYFKSLRNAFAFKKMEGGYICRYENLGDRLSASFEKHYEIQHCGLVVGSFKLNWRFHTVGDNQAVVDVCKVSGLKLGL